MKKFSAPSDPRELNPYSGPKNFNEVLKFLGINSDDFESAAEMLDSPEESEISPVNDEGEDEIDLRPRRSRRAFGLPEKKTLDQRL